MGSIKLTGDGAASVSILSNIFIDHYMPEANGTFVKIYLYLLRCLQANRRISLPEIADRLCCEDNDVRRGITYWIRKGVLQMSYDEEGNPQSIVLCHLEIPDDTPTPVNIADFQLLRPDTEKEKKAKETVTEPEELPAKKPASAKSSRQPSLEDLSNALEDPDFLDLKNQAEGFFDRPLADDDINALWRIYGDLKLPFPVCEYLLEYCATDREAHPERTKPSYYEKVARKWKEQNITTPEEAKKTTPNYFFAIKLLKALGIRNREPIEKEIRMLTKWQTEYHFSDEVLLLACEKAVLRKPSSAGFTYVGGILDSWYQKGIRTVDDVEKETVPSAPRRASGGDFLKRSSSDDLSYIEQLAMKQIKES